MDSVAVSGFSGVAVASFLIRPLSSPPSETLRCFLGGSANVPGCSAAGLRERRSRGVNGGY